MRLFGGGAYAGLSLVALWATKSNRRPRRGRRIGVALQEAGLDPRQTGRELLTLHGLLVMLALTVWMIRNYD